MPRAKRICPKPGCPHIADGRYCTKHNAAYEAERGTSTARGYGSKHQRKRAELNIEVQKGKTPCARCGQIIRPDTPWALDHDDLDRTKYLGASHVYCNDSAGGKKAHAQPEMEGSNMAPDLTKMLAERDALRAARDSAKAVAASDITLVYGPPCSGKTTYVAKHGSPGDLVIDYDAIAVALGSSNSHDHPRSLHPFILHTIDALLERSRRSPDVKVWLIKCDPTQRDIAISNTHTRMTTDREECKRRAIESGRPITWAGHIDKWFQTHP